MQEYQSLFLKGSTRTSTGAYSFTSTTSSTTYSSTTGGENDVFGQLKTALANYMILAIDFNGKLDISAFNNSFIKGTNTFNSTTGVTITHNIGNTNYYVSIIPTSNASGYLGEIYVKKNANNIIVYCSGTSTTTTFDYILFK
jgi:hypothetical protein